MSSFVPMAVRMLAFAVLFGASASNCSRLLPRSIRLPAGSAGSRGTDNTPGLASAESAEHPSSRILDAAFPGPRSSSGLQTLTASRQAEFSNPTQAFAALLLGFNPTHGRQCTHEMHGRHCAPPVPRVVMQETGVSVRPSRLALSAIPILSMWSRVARHAEDYIPDKLDDTATEEFVNKFTEVHRILSKMGSPQTRWGEWGAPSEIIALVRPPFEIGDRMNLFTASTDVFALAPIWNIWWNEGNAKMQEVAKLQGLADSASGPAWRMRVLQIRDVVAAPIMAGHFNIQVSPEFMDALRTELLLRIVRLAASSGMLVVVLADPLSQDYYERVGFERIDANSPGMVYNKPLPEITDNWQLAILQKC